ncbi:aldo/keto reductase [Nocardia wallacei]|uniref:aldo/keto reductase n=1 Tax=Nocardia wallacei TaxID=480035 RepID=UPI002457A678|nr:aldo/keto reductase [Nocardia wallacei]
MRTGDTAADRPGGTDSLAGRPVSRIGFGAMQLVAYGAGRPVVDRGTAIGVLRHVIASGINHIDTAQFYGAGACNALIREALQPFPEELVLVSKVGADETAGGLVAAQQPAQLRRQVEDNLTALGVDRIPVVNLRRVDAPPGIVAEGDQRVDLDSQLAELLDLRTEGKIGAIGLSNVGAGQLRQALPAGIACVQNAHNPLDRAAEPVLDLCHRHDIAWVPFMPLGSGFPETVKATALPAVQEIATALRATPAQVVLAWHLAHYSHTLLIPGTANIAHLDDNIAAGQLVLSPEAMSVLNRLADVRPSA